MEIISTSDCPVSWNDKDGTPITVWITAGKASYNFPLNNPKVLLQLNAYEDVGTITPEIKIPRISIDEMDKLIKEGREQDTIKENPYLPAGYAEQAVEEIAEQAVEEPKDVQTDAKPVKKAGTAKSRSVRTRALPKKDKKDSSKK